MRILTHLERKLLAERDATAKRNNKTVLSISMDGKAPIHGPHFPRLPKSLFARQRVRHQLWGLVNVGLNIYEFFPFFDWWLHDPNLTISLLWIHLVSILRTRGRHDLLYLQADNCARENKNRWMLCFLALLVLKGYFKEIQLHFLMAGHSHEKVLK